MENQWSRTQETQYTDYPLLVKRWLVSVMVVTKSRLINSFPLTTGAAYIRVLFFLAH